MVLRKRAESRSRCSSLSHLLFCENRGHKRTEGWRVHLLIEEEGGAAEDPRGGTVA